MMKQGSDNATAATSAVLQYAGPPRQAGRILVAIALLLVAGICLVGWLHLQRAQADIRNAANKELASIADLKVQQIVNWRRERLNDADLMHSVFYTNQKVVDALAHPDSTATRSLLSEFLQPLQLGGYYERVFLLDASLKVRASNPPVASPTPDETARLAAQQALQSRQVVVADLHQDTGVGTVLIDFAEPLISPGVSADSHNSQPGPAGLPAGRCIGVLILQVDAHAFLFPLIQTWPAVSRTAETLLVRREGEEVLYLSELRHQKGTAMVLRRPLSESLLPAAMALRGEGGPYEGFDYRGVPVIAVARSIPGTSWTMVAKEDAAELYEPARQEALRVFEIVLALSAVAFLLTVLTWRRTNEQWMRNHLQTEHEKHILAKRFGHLMRGAYDAIVVLDEDWRVLEFNSRAQEYYGYTTEEIRTKTLPDLRTPEARKTFPDLAAILEANGQALLETVHQRKDGSTFPAECSIRRVAIDGKQFILSIIRDITERKQHEAEIKRLSRLYATLSQVNQCILKSSGRAELLSDTCRTVVESGQFKAAWIGWKQADKGIPAEQAHYADSMNSELVMPGWQAGCGVMAETVRTGAACLCADAQADPRAGCCAAVLKGIGVQACAAYPLRLRGEVAGVLSICSIDRAYFGAQETDLLEKIAANISFALDWLDEDARRKELEEDLRSSEEHFRRAVVGSPFPTMLHADDGQILHVSDSWCEITGYTRGELKTIGDWTERAYGERKGLMLTDIDALYSLDRRKYEGDYTIRIKSGTNRIWEFSSASLGRLPDGRRLVISMAMDVTERRRIEAEISRLNSELERRVADRTAELNAANKELEAFSYSVSHDLRAPLRAVDGFAGILAEEQAERLDAEGQRLLGVIRSEAGRMGQLIDDLLNFARAGRTAMKKGTINMAAMAEGVFKDQARLFFERQLELKMTPLPLAWGDRAMIQMVWTNLISNAIKFTKYKTKAVIEIGAAYQDFDGVCYYIKDNGAGFNMKYAHKLFGVFQRLHDSASFEGTGVGLALAQRIILRHGGRIWAEGKVDEGATFYFALSREECRS